jgi:hypothetical protein
VPIIILGKVKAVKTGPGIVNVFQLLPSYSCIEYMREHPDGFGVKAPNVTVVAEVAPI